LAFVDDPKANGVPEISKLVVALITPPVTFPPALMFVVTVSLPATLMVDPDCLMIESSTFAAPPLLANTGTLPFLQAVPEEQVMVLAGGA
jgi:hypothetical protein